MVIKNLNGLKVLMKLGGTEKVRQFILGDSKKVKYDKDNYIHNYLFCFLIRNKKVFDFDWVRYEMKNSFGIEINKKTEEIEDMIKKVKNRIERNKNFIKGGVVQRKRIFKQKCFELLKKDNVNISFNDLDSFKFISPARAKIFCINRGKRKKYAFGIKNGRVIVNEGG